tara:strand:+ start:1635 stop:1826 length:192 start_codon:yes stop_codon:yes gene_type:complete
MARQVYKYTINVLKKVSFDPYLFKKELDKASKKLLPYELKELEIWVAAYVFNKPVLKEFLQTI